MTSSEQDGVALAGHCRTTETEDVSDPIRLTGGGHRVVVHNLSSAVEVSLLGHGHEVALDGADVPVTVHFNGYGNRVSVGPYVEATVETDNGYDNAVTDLAAELSADRFIEQTRAEAYSAAGTGVEMVVYQTVAADREFCRGCGEKARTILHRHREKSLFLFGHRLFSFESGSVSDECEHCALPADVELTDLERRNIFG